MNTSDVTTLEVRSFYPCSIVVSIYSSADTKPTKEMAEQIIDKIRQHFGIEDPMLRMARSFAATQKTKLR